MVRIRAITQRRFLTNVQESGTFDEKLTPWFKLIANNYLRDWWQNLDNLEACSNPGEIDNFCSCGDVQS